MYFDPWSYLTPWSSRPRHDYYYEDDEPATWSEHFAKGFASMGVLGFLKVLVASPFSYFRLGGGGGRGRNGRDRYEQISWIIILIGVGTFLMVSTCLTRIICYENIKCNRLFTKVFAPGVAARSKELVNELWTFKVMTTMMKTKCPSALSTRTCNAFLHFDPSCFLNLLLRGPHYLKLPRVTPQYCVN